MGGQTVTPLHAAAAGSVDDCTKRIVQTACGYKFHAEERDEGSRVMKKLLAILLLAYATPALACSPASTCWYKYGPTYIRGICQNTLRNFRSMAQISESLDEPEKLSEFVAVCRKLQVNLTVK